MDVPLQCISFLGKIFAEGSVTFGASSSPSIFHRISEIILVLAVIIAVIRKRQTLKQLDDVVAFGAKLVVTRFHATYEKVCGDLGVRLAPDTDKDKCFAATQEGVILGIFYNTQSWTWSFSMKKARKMLEAIAEIMDNTVVTKAVLDGLVGRLNFYHQIMGPQARFERGFLILAANEKSRQTDKIKCSSNMISQAAWWRRNIIASLQYSEIPDPGRWEPQNTVMIFPDASGGANMRDLRGSGVVTRYNGICYWSFLSHSEMIKENARALSGERLGNKLTFLELLAALLGLVTLPEIIRNRHVTVMTDNIGAVYAFKKGYSTDVYSYTVAKALEVVARGLNCRLVIKKTPRRSGDLEKVADHISKGEFREAKMIMGRGHQLRFPPKTLVKFLDSPRPTRVLGSAILKELQEYTDVVTPEVEWDWEVERLTARRKSNVDNRLIPAGGKKLRR